MHITPQLLRAAALLVFLAIIYAGRLAKGTARETPEGLVFGMKPLVLWTRALAIPLYLAIILMPLMAAHQRPPIWLPLAILAVVALAAYQLPGTIVLTPMAVVQHFWLRADAVIQYNEVMTIQALRVGQITRVLGDNRVTITHNSAHADADTFRKELERRTGKRLVT